MVLFTRPNRQITGGISIPAPTPTRSPPPRPTPTSRPTQAGNPAPAAARSPRSHARQTVSFARPKQQFTGGGGIPAPPHTGESEALAIKPTLRFAHAGECRSELDPCREPRTGGGPQPDPMRGRWSCSRGQTGRSPAASASPHQPQPAARPLGRPPRRDPPTPGTPHRRRAAARSPTWQAVSFAPPETSRVAPVCGYHLGEA